ncbi:hypothetical protein H6A12_12040 [Phocea massiliensis]|uniref:Uncharacterized protein n=1 Tax=Merdimmobilis hominis TaxID=2897707 RepID=A0A938X9V2_9FIRM|nr:hypothetical protein [Merdimmobilis hominis]MBM6921876.1 hypothetical protein [Merdimmobilis hominis]
MIKITSPADLKKIHDSYISLYIQNLLEYILREYISYCPDQSIEEQIGAIFLLEQESDIHLYQQMGLSSPLKESQFEWLKQLSYGYSNGCIVLDNDRAINIIGKSSYFKPIQEETK